MRRHFRTYDSFHSRCAHIGLSLFTNVDTFVSPLFGTFVNNRVLDIPSNQVRTAWYGTKVAHERMTGIFNSETSICFYIPCYLMSSLDVFKTCSWVVPALVRGQPYVVRTQVSQNVLTFLLRVVPPFEIAEQTR